MPFQCEVPTRWGDMDALAHFNNVVYLDYLREARTQLFLSGPHAQLAEAGVKVVSEKLEYLAPGIFDGRPLVVSVMVHDVGEDGFSLGYELRIHDELIMRAHSTIAARDPQADGVRPLRTVELEWLESVSEAFEPLRTLPRADIGDHECHRFPQRIRRSDLDASGHVNTVRFGDYFQEARVEIIWGNGAPELRGKWLAARFDVEYLADLGFRPEPYSVRTAVQKIGKTSLTLTCDLCDEASGTRYAAAVVVVVFGGETATPTPIGEGMRTRLAPWSLE